ncbi:MAG: hypothetical protein JSS89_07950 [Bacteroidetes bacterium]|nr:hypothetical protein [Bacteroidota bacterium]
MIYGPLMHSASLHYFLRTDQNRYLCLGYSPVATQWSELMERSYRSIVFQGVVRDNMNPYESAVSGNGRFVAAIDTLRMIRFYDMEYESQYGVPLYRSTLARMYGVAQQISSSGKYFMFTTRQSGVRDSVGCYDIEAGDVIWKISNGDTIDEIATHPTMPWLVVREHAGNRSMSVILDERSGSTVATIQDAKVLGWVGRGRVAMIEQDTSYVFRDVTAGTDLPLRFATNGGIRTPVLTADGKHVVVGWIRHTDSASYQKVLRYDLVSGLAIDSIEFVGDHLDRLDCADDGSVVVASDEKAYVYLKFGTAPVYRTWGTEGFGWILFDSKLGLLRVSRSSGSTTYDLASGTPVYDRPLGGFLDADRVVRIPTQKRYMMFSSIPKRSFYVCEYEHPFESYTRQLPKAIVATAQEAQFGSLACVMSDSTFALLNTSDNSLEEIVKLPLSMVRMIDQPSEPRTYYVASDTLLLSVNSLSKQFDTVAVLPHKRVLVGGTFLRERNEFALLTYKKSSKLVYVSFVSKDGVITESDSVMTAQSDVVGQQVLVKAVDSGRRLLASWTNQGYCILDLATRKVERIVNNRSYEWVTDCNDSLAAYYTDSALCVIDLRDLHVDTLRQYVRNQYLRSAIFSQRGKLLTVYDTKSLNILQYDWKTKTLVDSLPRSFGIATLTIADDDCAMYLHSEADAVITWSTCGTIDWEGDVRTSVQTSTSVDAHDGPTVEHESRTISCVDGTLTVPVVSMEQTSIAFYSTLGQEILTMHSDQNHEGKAYFDVRGLQSGLYIAVVNGGRSLLVSVVK